MHVPCEVWIGIGVFLLILGTAITKILGNAEAREVGGTLLGWWLRRK